MHSVLSYVWQQSRLTRIILELILFLYCQHWKIVPQTENFIQNDKPAYPWEQQEM